MSSAQVVALPRAEPERGRLACVRCGTTIDAPCGCGLMYEYVKPAKRAALAIAITPEKSDRAIAADIGVSQPTVSRARKHATETNVSVADVGEPAKRTGRDGKARKPPKPKVTKPKPTPKPKPVPSPAALARDETNKLLERLSRHVDDDCRTIRAFLAAHADLESEGRATLHEFLQLNANKLMTLAQEVDGR